MPRRGSDRFEVGDAVCDTLLPEEAGHLLGVKLGDGLDGVRARFGEPEPGDRAALYRFTLEDPFNNDRRVEVRLFHQNQRVHILDGRFYSNDRMDVDAAYRSVRKQLKAHHGRPGKEMTGVLKFVYEVEDGPAPCRTTICRYRDSEGRNVLEVATKLQDGARLPAPQGPGRLSNAKGS